MTSTHTNKLICLLAALCIAGGLLLGSSSLVAASGPNMVAQWNKIAEDTVVGSGAAQIEGLVYMSYTQAAVYDAVVAIKGRYAPYGHRIEAPAGASANAAVVEAAYETLVYYFPASEATLGAARDASLATIADGRAKRGGIRVGHRAAQEIIALRTGDGRLTPIATTSPSRPRRPVRVSGGSPRRHTSPRRSRGPEA